MIANTFLMDCAKRDCPNSSHLKTRPTKAVADADGNSRRASANGRPHESVIGAPQHVRSPPALLCPLLCKRPGQGCHERSFPTVVRAHRGHANVYNAV